MEKLRVGCRLNLLQGVYVKRFQMNLTLVQTGPLEYMLRLKLIYFVTCVDNRKQFKMKSN